MGVMALAARPAQRGKETGNRRRMGVSRPTHPSLTRRGVGVLLHTRWHGRGARTPLAVSPAVRSPRRRRSGKRQLVRCRRGLLRAAEALFDGSPPPPSPVRSVFASVWKEGAAPAVSRLSPPPPCPGRHERRLGRHPAVVLAVAWSWKVPAAACTKACVCGGGARQVNIRALRFHAGGRGSGRAAFPRETAAAAAAAHSGLRRQRVTAPEREAIGGKRRGLIEGS